MAKQKGNRVLAGTWAEIWIDGAHIFDCYKISAKISANREDVQIGIDIDSKMTGLKGEGEFAVKKVYSRHQATFEAWARGEDPRAQIITKLADPDAVGKKQERYSIDNVWFNELPVVDWEKGKAVDLSTSFGFTPSDMQVLDQVSA